MIQQKIQQTIAVIALLLFTGPAASEEFAGPLAQANRYPVAFMFMTPIPHTPELPDGPVLVRLRADYTSVHIDKSSDSYELLTDMEIGAVTPELEVKLGGRASLGLSLPMLSYTGGFLDGPLETYHDLGNFPEYGRSLRPKNEFACVVKKNGKTWFTAKRHGLHPADMRIDVKYALTGTDRLKSSILASLKLPTGDEHKGFGSGKTDYGMSLLTRMTFGKTSLYLNPGFIIPADPETDGADITYKSMATLFAGLEYAVSPTFSLMAQVNAFTSPLENTGIDTLDNPSVELALGFTRRWGWNIRSTFSFCEDLSGLAPDFTVHAGVETCFGG